MLPYTEKARNIHEACGENADQFLELSSTAGSPEACFTSVLKVHILIQILQNSWVCKHTLAFSRERGYFMRLMLPATGCTRNIILLHSMQQRAPVGCDSKAHQHVAHSLVHVDILQKTCTRELFGACRRGLHRVQHIGGH